MSVHLHRCPVEGCRTILVDEPAVADRQEEPATERCQCGHPKRSHYFGDRLGADGRMHTWCQKAECACQDFAYPAPEREARVPVERSDVLWRGLMTCSDCGHRMVEHDEEAMRCRTCSCDQSSRGLSCHADSHLIALGVAMKEIDEA